MNPQPISPLHAQADPPLVHSYRHLVCHLGELTLKGGNRGYFESVLIRNLRAKFDAVGIAAIQKLPGRVVLEFQEAVPFETLAEKAATVIGIANAVPVLTIEPTIEQIESAVRRALVGERFASFAVRCSRGEKRFAYTSQQICVRVGAMVQALSGARVDLETPELTVWIAVLSHQAFVGTERIAAPAGLPVGVSGRVVCLLSAGIDSPVAAWRMMLRGCEPVLLHFHSAPFTSAASQEKVHELVRRLARWHAPLRLGMLSFGDIQQVLVAQTPEPYRVILYRRMMVRMAAALAVICKAGALVTGDSLAQVASQTLSNLATVEAAASLPILRPLIGMDKNEIIRTARHLGTYEISIEPHADCCTFLEPRRPVTRSRVIDLERIESPLAMDEMVARGVTQTQWSIIN